MDSPRAWAVRADIGSTSDLCGLNIPKVEREWGEEDVDETEAMDEDEVENVDDMEENKNNEDDEEQDEGEEMDRFRQLILDNKIDMSQLALLKGLPVMALDTLIARKDFPEADMKKTNGE